MEKFVRNSILKGLKEINYFDFLWISDIDEIPNINSLFKLGRSCMIQSYYKNEYFVGRTTCTRNKGYSWKTHFNSKPDKIRWTKWKYGLHIKNGGWHFSYLMSPKND